MDKTIDHRLAWLAGIIDGEGTVSIGLRRLVPSAVRRLQRLGRSSDSKAAHFMVVVSNTDERMISEIRSIADTLGIKQVTSQYFPPRLRHPNSRPQWRITFKTRGAVDVLLRAVHPYLITKLAQADLVLRAVAHRQSLGQPRRGDSGYVKIGEDAKLAAMIEESHRLNRRGLAPTEG